MWFPNILIYFDIYLVRFPTASHTPGIRFYPFPIDPVRSHRFLTVPTLKMRHACGIVPASVQAFTVLEMQEEKTYEEPSLSMRRLDADGFIY